MKCVRILPSPALNVANLRDLNSYELTGHHRRGAALDDLILAHLAVQAELRKLDAYQELIVRYMAEGYNLSEIAREIGCTPQTVARHAEQLRWSLFGVDAADALAKQRCAA